MSGAAPGDPDLVYASARGRWVLLATVLGSAVASIDATVVGIALPAIGRDFNVGMDSLQWVVTAYTLTLAGLLLLAGSLGDKYGRKRVFVTGVIWFALASLLCSVAPTSGVLIAARALQGIGAALLTPGSLAILQATFRPDDRGKAIGAWSGFAGVGTAIGPFIGGWLVSAVSWRLIFVINLPLAALVVAVALRHVPETRDPEATGPIDVVGGILVTFGLIGLTYGLIQGPNAGWSNGPVLAALIGGVVLLAAFVWWERRTPSPMLELSLFSSTQFTATNVVTFVVYGAIGGALFLLPIQLQQVSGYSPLGAGISLLPVTAITLALSSRSGALAARIGPRLQMSVGPGAGGRGHRPVRADRPGRELPDRGAARGARLRLRPGRDRGPADVDRAGGGAGRARGHGVGREQRRRAGRRPHRRGPAARRGRHHRRRLPARRASSRPGSAPPRSSRRACACSAACWPRSRSATRAACRRRRRPHSSRSTAPWTRRLRSPPSPSRPRRAARPLEHIPVASVTAAASA